MCLILFQIAKHPAVPLIMAANRDEFYNRPTRPMEFWKENPNILAGKDLQAGGTWMGINTQGRFAALTNYRDMAQVKMNAPSRGELIPRLLNFTGTIPEFFKKLEPTASTYNGFNLLAGEKGQVYWYSNQNRTITQVESGTHGLSNHLLDTPWPKVTRGREMLEKIISDTPQNNDPIFDLLTNTQCPQDSQLPNTGIGLEWERILSPLFIQSPTYGTRCSTIMRILQDGSIHVTERTFAQAPDPECQAHYKDRFFTISPLTNTGLKAKIHLQSPADYDRKDATE